MRPISKWIMTKRAAQLVSFAAYASMAVVAAIALLA
jgi:hypothetical protein